MNTNTKQTTTLSQVTGNGKNSITLFNGGQIIETIKTEMNIDPDFAQMKLAKFAESNERTETLSAVITVNDQTRTFQFHNERGLIETTPKVDAVVEYYMTRTETGRKASKFIYKIYDQSGKLISERNSNREYVAATICGSFFFGRIDLIGKGDHGRNLSFCKKQTEITESKFNASGYYSLKTFTEYVQSFQESIDRLSKIAHLKN